MSIESEFVIGDLEFSKTLPKRYTWNDLIATEWPDKWRIPTLKELKILYKSEPMSHTHKVFWALVPLSPNGNFAHGVYFILGSDHHYQRDSLQYVKLVRHV